MTITKNISTFLLSTARSVALFSTPAVAGKAEIKELKKATKTCQKVHPSSVEGCALAFSRRHGNCLACHAIQGGSLAGNWGPPLVAMKARFPDKSKLRAQIWDSTVANPVSSMPPFGKHKIIKESEIDKITNFIHSL